MVEEHESLLSFIVNPRTSQVVKVEWIDKGGARRELSAEEKSNLAKEKGQVTLEGILEQAFEAGIASVFGGTGREKDRPESGRDAKVRRLLLQPLIDNSAAKRLMRDDVLSKAVVDKLVCLATTAERNRVDTAAAPGA